MKKFLSLVLLIMMLASMMTVSSNAAYSKTEAPEWMITKIANDSADIDGTYPPIANDDGNYWKAEIFEAMELVNISGKTLNLYEYGIHYGGYNRNHADFNRIMYEFTPFKAGDFRDGTSFSEWTNMPMNPETCMVEPGEIVIIWVTFIENKPGYPGNGGNPTIDDFRKHWKLSDDIKVIAFDGNSKADDYCKGHGKNFSFKDSGIVWYCED